jgi:hypothetical protein
MRNRIGLAIAFVLVGVLIRASWLGVFNKPPVSIWLARFQPVSVRSIALTPAEREEYRGANVDKFLVVGRVSSGAMLKCWVETYYLGELVEDQEVVRLEVPLANQPLTITSSREAVAEDEQWERQEWTLTIGSEPVRGTIPFYSNLSSMSGGTSGPLDLSRGEPVSLTVAAWGDEAPEPGWGREVRDGVAPSDIGLMEHVYLLKVMVSR